MEELRSLNNKMISLTKEIIDNIFKSEVDKVELIDLFLHTVRINFITATEDGNIKGVNLSGTIPNEGYTQFQDIEIKRRFDRIKNLILQTEFDESKFEIDKNEFRYSLSFFFKI